MSLRLLVLPLSIVLLCGCGNKDKKDDDSAKEMARLEHSDNNVEVEVMELREVPFKRQLATNGKLRARNKCVLSFKTSGTIEKIHITNGRHAAAGMVLAELDPTEARNSLTSAMQNFEKAKIDLNDAIIGFGYENVDDPAIPERTMELAKIRSGFNTSEMNLLNARNNLEACVLKAPFSGKVANINGNMHERCGSDFCTLVDDSRLVVEFNVLETELGFVQVGNVVKVASFFDPENYVSGKVTTVNPVVDKNGQVLVEAEIANNGTFIDGMNVKLLIEKELSNKLVVPKNAVVMRDNHEVLFRYRDGKAHWTYVHTLMDNSSEYVVTANMERGADLSVGDMIIVSGNLNLADGTLVSIKQ